MPCSSASLWNGWGSERDADFSFLDVAPLASSGAAGALRLGAIVASWRALTECSMHDLAGEYKRRRVIDGERFLRREWCFHSKLGSNLLSELQRPARPPSHVSAQVVRERIGRSSPDLSISLPASWGLQIDLCSWLARSAGALPQTAAQPGLPGQGWGPRHRCSLLWSPPRGHGFEKL